MRFLGNSLFTILLLSAAVVAAAPIYTWQDDQGRVYFSDQPVSENDNLIKTDLSTKASTPSSGQQVNEADQYTIRKQVEYFDRKREKQQEIQLEQKRLKQVARAQELQAQQLRQEAEYAEQEREASRGVVYAQPYNYRPPYYLHQAYVQHPRKTYNQEQAHNPLYLQHERQMQRIKHMQNKRYERRNPVGAPSYGLQYQHHGDHHRFGLNLGNYSYPY